MDASKRELKRKQRVRSKIVGTAQRPRLSIAVSNRHIYAQAIDDTRGKTMLFLSTLSGELKNEVKNKKNKEAAKILGAHFGQKAKALGIESAVFDRGSCRYQGRLQALADSVRAAGVKF